MGRGRGEQKQNLVGVSRDQPALINDPQAPVFQHLLNAFRSFGSVELECLSGYRDLGLKFGDPKDPEEILLQISEFPKKVVLNNIEVVSAEGRGRGTRALESLKEYCDDAGKDLEVSEVISEGFFDQFSWLTVDPDSET